MVIWSLIKMYAKYSNLLFFYYIVYESSTHNIFFYLGFLSRPIASHRTGGERGRHFFSSSLPLPLASPTIPSKHLLVLKTSWRSFQHVFSVIILRLPRRLEDILQDVLKTSWKTKNCFAKDVFKTCLEDVLKTLWRQTNDLLGISVSNISTFHKSIFDNSKTNPKCIN